MLPLVQDHQPRLTAKTQAGRLQRCEQPGGLSCSSLWRPWAPARDTEPPQEKFNSVTTLTESRPKVAHGFQHPVRLHVPKSRTQEYLSHLGKKILASFPVQATLDFYNDDSSSEEDDEDDEEHQTCLTGLDRRIAPSYPLSSER